MNTEYVKNLLDACFEAKKITELMPVLPKGMKPRHVTVIDTLHRLTVTQEYVKISDISDSLKITRPSVTKLVHELEEMHLIAKTGSATDNRITTIQLTEQGQEFYQTYVLECHSDLASQLSVIDDQDILTAAETIHRIHELIIANSNKGVR